MTAVASQAFLDAIGTELEAVVRDAARAALPAANEWHNGAVDRAFANWVENGGEVIRFNRQDDAASGCSCNNCVDNIC
jgi:hypothetical protein